MPVYHLMALSLNADGFHELEGISRDFLWGQNDFGEYNKALVAWEDIVLNKAEGGVGLESLAYLNLNLKMRLCGRLLSDDKATWISLANAGISHSLSTSFTRKTRRFWTGAEALLLDENIHIVGSPLLCDLFCGFNKARSKLLFVLEDIVLPDHLTMEQLLLLFCVDLSLQLGQICSVLGILNLHGIQTLGDLRVGGGWRSVVSFYRSSCPSCHGFDQSLV